MDELTALQSLADPEEVAQMAAYHKVGRPYLGIPTPQIGLLVADWRAARDVTGRVALAQVLWAKMNNPKPDDLDRRERILGWAGGAA